MSAFVNPGYIDKYVKSADWPPVNKVYKTISLEEAIEEIKAIKIGNKEEYLTLSE